MMRKCIIYTKSWGVDEKELEVRSNYSRTLDFSPSLSEPTVCDWKEFETGRF